VRGWNDPGSRISVKSTDTNEQRELMVSCPINLTANSNAYELLNE
jgi:hypothetical protein